MKEFDQYNKKIDVDILSKSVLDFDSVTDDIKGVILKTNIGGRRIMNKPLGDPIPRIC